MNDKTEKPLILIVDDQPLNTKLLEELLQDEYATRISTSGKEAIRIATSHPVPDLILLDIMMPEMDGFEVCRQLKADKRSEEIPIFFVSAINKTSDQIQGFELGAVEYVTKPYNTSLLKMRIRTHIQLKRNNDYLQEMADSSIYELDKIKRKTVVPDQIGSVFYVRFFLMVAFVISISILIYTSNVNTIRVITKNSEANNIEQQKNVLENALTGVFSDLQILTSSTHLIGMFEKSQTHPKILPSEEFKKFCFHKKIYDQISFLDKSGMEIIRIDSNGGSPSICPEDQLQPKGERYYFINTLKLPRGEIFVSPFDLNLEHGKIEIPIKPIIRFGTPVFDLSGQKQGVILLNFLGKILINKIELISEGNIGQTILLNSKGYFLKGYKQTDEWSFMYRDGPQKTFGSRYSKAWQKISWEREGQFENGEGLFTFATINPWSDYITSGSGSPDTFPKSGNQFTSSSNLWKIVSHVTEETFKSQTNNLVNGLLIGSGIIIAIWGCGLWLIASAVSRRRAAEIS